MAKNLHKQAFDEGTKVKLSLYANYIKEWLPVFLADSKPKCNVINIFDFFSGPGMDINNTKGSPLITIDLLYPYFENISKNNLTVKLYFNDKQQSKIKQLEKNISQLDIDLKPFKIIYSSDEFENIFWQYLPLMAKSKTANFLFLDQNGIKHVTDKIFKEIIKLSATDFLFFISSSTLYRFNESPEIKKYIDISLKQISASNYVHIHRNVLEYYRSLIPKGKEYYLSPFSIKKGANIYGLIFGTSHLLGIDKFIKQCWKIDTQTGDSNFDIDSDKINTSQLSLFGDTPRPKRIKMFEDELTNAILEQKIRTNKEIYIFTCNNGFKAEHARTVIKDMIRDGKIPKQHPYISYDSCKLGQKEQTIILK